MKIVPAHKAVVYMPLWTAQTYGFLSGIEALEVEQLEAPGDMACLKRLSELQTENQPAIGICDPSYLFHKHDGAGQSLQVIGTLIGPPPFWLAGFDLPTTDLDAAINSIDHLICYSRDFLTAQAVVQWLRDKKLATSSCKHSLESIYRPPGEEFKELLRLHSKNPLQRVGVLTADIVALSRIAARLPAKSGFTYTYVGQDDFFTSFVTTAIIANQSALRTPQATSDVVAGLQNSALAFATADTIKIMMLSKVVSDQKLIDRPADDMTKADGSVISFGGSELTPTESALIIKEFTAHHILNPDMTVDWRAFRCFEHFPDARNYDQVWANDRRLDRHIGRTAAQNLVNQYLPNLGQYQSALRGTLGTAVQLSVFAGVLFLVFGFLSTGVTGALAFVAFLGAWTFAAIAYAQLDKDRGRVAKGFADLKTLYDRFRRSRARRILSIVLGVVFVAGLTVYFFNPRDFKHHLTVPLESNYYGALELFGFRTHGDVLIKIMYIVVTLLLPDVLNLIGRAKKSFVDPSNRK